MTQPSHIGRRLPPHLSGLALLLLLACATNPVTRQSQLMLISQEQEIQIGQESSKEIQKEYGYYTGLPGLKPYVGSVGQKLVAQCDRRDITYHFQVLDTPVINAFALPGGYVYVTRGILARMNSEDELAAVLGHELTHVAARHSAQEMSKMAVAQVGVAAVGVLSPGAGQALGQFAGAALNLAFLGYSRKLEAQADEYGITYAERAGYNPRGAVKMFQMFQSIEADQPGRMQRFLMSHPPTADRLAYANQRFGQAAVEDPGLTDEKLRRDFFLRHIDGLQMGQSRGEKVVIGNVFYQKQYHVSLAPPISYEPNLGPTDPDAQAVFVKDVKQGETSATKYVAGLEIQSAVQPTRPEDYAQWYMGRLKVAHNVLAKDVTATAQGEGMALRVFDVTPQQGTTVRVLMGFLVRGGSGYVVYGYTESAYFEGAKPELMGILKSLRFLSDKELAGVRAPKLRLVTARTGDTWRAVAEREMHDGALGPKLAAFNGVFKAGRQPAAGMLIKIVDASFLEGK